jgi:hypothetical protein
MFLLRKLGLICLSNDVIEQFTPLAPEGGLALLRSYSENHRHPAPRAVTTGCFLMGGIAEALLVDLAELLF